jgi:hypothetical protein
MGADAIAELEAAREAVLAEGEAVVDALVPSIGESLRAGVTRLRLEQPDVAARLEGPVVSAFDQAVEGAIRSGVAQVLERLRDPEIWLAPLTAPNLVVVKKEGWPTWLPEPFARLLARRQREPAALGEIDDPSNRIWVAVCAASAPLDAVLEEFGFRPGRPRIGGGRFDVGPRTLPRLDPTGGLRGPWRRYRDAYRRLSALTLDPDPRGGGS